MNGGSGRRALALIAIGAAAGVAALTANADSAGPISTAEAKNWSFDVLLDDRMIGRHDFRLRRDGDVEQIDIEARFEVSLLFITAYEYEHENTERWKDGCLASIRSRTDDNGEQYTVQGSDSGAVFEIERNASPAVFEKDCLRTFAYWDSSILDASELLNSQTGEVEAVDVRYLGREKIDFDGRGIESDRYALRTEDGDIEVWYAVDGGQWLALEAPARGDRVIRYRPRTIPGFAATTPRDDRRLALE